ncbi:pyruvate dehydrogenase (acetyl-transferring), homodimeric type [Candidatus Purcelliella pentastirinorum]|uniref:pyruvate dehydrogenase (acetyl-transferring), homodimeric type n=1 Tax=Candidatus Purcelliella pentastirinorum TaxID=472834 RepID=UPI000E2503D7|nr:pyruvate dehydrogenase (acetyl-transferring), homodimeric type [Candidatus Purcelliella pentastirinorum]
MVNSEFNDIDSIETIEWLESIKSVIHNDGIERAKYLLNKISKVIFRNEHFNDYLNKFNYINTISVEEEPIYPGNIVIEDRICSAVRWNAIMIVLRASRKKLDLGGHLSSFQSVAHIYEVCFNHFFRIYGDDNIGDLVYFQGHISPGIYSRAFLENRLTEIQLNNFRQEICGNGISSYPHPKLMPNFWQFPTVSMGLSALNAIYQAKFLKYLYNRGLDDTSKRTVYAFLGDGEMDEPESKGAINIASRDKLDNLIFVINCNLQRLDGPVYGNGKIIMELENFFLGAGWEVIKVIWGSNWDPLLKKDVNGKLIKLMNETVDGEYQTLQSKNGMYIREHFFGKYSETKDLVKDITDIDIFNLVRGGHDYKKIYAAFKKAQVVKNKPVVILFHTVKGYGLTSNIESKNISHQVKDISFDDLCSIRDNLQISIDNNGISNLLFVKFAKGSDEYEYLHDRRKVLGGYLPNRNMYNLKDKLILPKLSDFKSLLKKQNKKISTTIAFIRILNIILRNYSIKDRVVPIVADEARTFGMEGLFRKIGIYNSNGQKYIPQDYNETFYYKEDKNGQILQEGINELGAISSWISASTSYCTNNLTMIPFYIYYSMFGFQRVGDSLWAAGDQQAKGFLIGGTSGRTTLNGEGLQHADGHSHIYSLTIPNCISYNPAYSYEIAVIIYDGLLRMYGPNHENVYYYITTFNENYHMPSMPPNSEYGIKKGIYKLETLNGSKSSVQLLGSGSILQHVRMAARILSNRYDIASDVYSVTSFTELARDGQDCARWNLLHPNDVNKSSYISCVMNSFPALAVTDYIKLFAEQISSYVPSDKYFVLGTDGFGMSDSRFNLRNYFEISYPYIVICVLSILVQLKDISSIFFNHAIDLFGIDVNKINPRLF